MKLHKTLVDAVVKTLEQIFTQGVYADDAVERVLKQNLKWGSRDRRFIAETIYEVVRWWRLLDAIAKETDSEKRMYELVAIQLVLKGHVLPEWQEFNGIDIQFILNKVEQLKGIRKIRESFPDWMDQLLADELGDNVWEKEACALNTSADVVLRVNTLRTNKEQLQKKLMEQGVETSTIDGYGDALRLAKRQNLHVLKEYQQGLFELQDASSQLIAPFLELSSGQTVIDACAGAGGKSLHIASLLHNKGKIISMDVEERKLTELQRRATRAGVSIIHTDPIGPHVLKKYYHTADRLLLDAPCSGLGVIRRNPDAKWKLSPDFIEKIKQTQQSILSDYSEMLKPGGILVYATCSILPSENQKQIELFLKNHNDFQFVSDQKILPSEGFDGFYMAKLKRLN